MLGIRPEHFHPPRKGQRSLKLQVDLVEPLGAETLIHGRLQGLDQEIVVRLPGTPDVAPGGTVPIVVDQERFFLFDSDSDARIT